MFERINRDDGRGRDRPPGAAEVESFEISVYENLILYAQAMNQLDVVHLLRPIAQSERAALVKIRTLQSELAPVRSLGSK